MMKKMIFVLLIMAIFFQISQAQIRIGGMAGVNFSNLIIKHNVPTLDIWLPEMDKGFFAGVTSNFFLREKFYFLGDLKYASRGYRYTKLRSGVVRKFRVNYLELTPKVEFRPIEFFGLAMGLNYGAFVERGMKQGDEEWGEDDSGITFNENVALTGSLRGYLKNAFIEIGYELGFENIKEVNYTGIDGESIGTSKSYLRNFNLGVGYLFEL